MYFDDFQEGYRVKTNPVKMEKQKMIEFAKLYDRIPLHTDEEFAKTTRFKGLIASGFYTICSIYGEFTQEHIWKDGHIVGDKAAYEFPVPVYPGDILTGVFTVTKKKQLSANKGVIQETMEIFNQDDVLVVKGSWNKYLKLRPVE